MRYKLAEDAKPQVILLIIATIITLALWFIPYADILVYPIRLFVTFIHEGSHALIAVLTGGSVQSLTIGSDGSGVVYSASSSWLSNVLTSSAGYLGTTVFGAMLLVLMRKSVSSNKILLGIGIFIGALTLLFGIISPIFNIFSLNVGLSSVAFTVVTGSILSAALIALGMLGSVRVANFAVAFLAIQCLMNALADLKTVLFINTPLMGAEIQNDATNMANATGIPGILWVLIWIVISVVVISLGLRVYAVTRKPGSGDSVFED